MGWALDTAARTLLQEARNEPPEGQAAVAHVILNRVKTGRWGKSLATVCLSEDQFSGWHNPKDPNFTYACNLRDDDPALARARAVLQAATLATVDPTQGALFYYAPKAMVPPDRVPGWVMGNKEKHIEPMRFCGKFGSQLFYSDRAEGALMS